MTSAYIKHGEIDTHYLSALQYAFYKIGSRENSLFIYRGTQN